MSMATPRRALIAAGVLAQLSGCYRTTNVAVVPRLHTAYPVSASSQYVDGSGAIVTDTDYEIIQQFQLTRAVAAPRHDDTITQLAFEADLDRILSANHGDALTGVRISATDYDHGSHGSSGMWKMYGWTLGLTGAAFAGTGIAVGDDFAGSDIGTKLVWTGAATVGVGLLCYLVGVAVRKPAVWHLEVSGNVVKRVAPADPVVQQHAAQ